MKNNGKILKTCIIISICILMVSACSPRNNLVGTWQSEQSGETLVFFKDGTITATSMGLPVTGSYEVLDSSNLKITISGLFGLGGAQVYGYSVSGKTLTLTIYGVTTNYTQVK